MVGDVMASEVIAILDLEYTAWKGSREHGWSKPGEYREIVEIGLILLHGPELREIAAAGLLVRPHRNPVLSDYFKTLTGIEQAAVDVAPSIETAGAMIANLLDPELLSRPGSLWSFGEDGEIFLENFALVDRPSPIPASCFRNIREPLTTNLGLPAHGVDSSNLPAALGLPPLPYGHRAVDDCRAIAAALRHARRLRVQL